MKYNSIMRQLIKSIDVLTSIDSMQNCTTPGCHNTVSKEGHKLCYSCWKQKNTKSVAQPPQKQHQPTSSSHLLSATQISELLKINVNHVNPIFAELGWLAKNQGWVATPQGLALGAVQKIFPQTNLRYVLWPESILKNPVLLKTLESFQGIEIYSVSTSSETVNQENNLDHRTSNHTNSDFREKFKNQAKLRSIDGHWVRSKAELIIDNWLYMSGLVHAYERRLPIEEEVYCDFYLPTGKVYIEYWGYDNNSEYTERKKIKQELYQKYNFNLVELSDEEVKNLDDYLPKILLKFGITLN